MKDAQPLNSEPDKSWPYCARCGFSEGFCYCKSPQDIVARLRKRSFGLMQEAAGEIEGLRAALEAIIAEDSTNGYIMQQIAKEARRG